MKSLLAVCDAAIRVVWSAWTVSRPHLSAIKEGLARHSGHRPKNQERTMDVDGEERVLTKSVVTPELIVRGQQITLRREEVR